MTDVVALARRQAREANEANPCPPIRDEVVARLRHIVKPVESEPLAA